MEYEGFALVRVCMRYLDLDKAIYFHLINKARKLFNEVSNCRFMLTVKVISTRKGHANMISNWGLGISLYLHGRAIDTDVDIKAKTATTLLLKSQEHMTYIVYRLKLTKEEGMERFIKRPYYYLACVNATMNLAEESLFWLTKARVKGSLPRDETEVYRDFAKIIKTKYVLDCYQQLKLKRI